MNEVAAMNQLSSNLHFMMVCIFNFVDNEHDSLNHFRIITNPNIRLALERKKIRRFFVLKSVMTDEQ